MVRCLKGDKRELLLQIIEAAVLISALIKCIFDFKHGRTINELNALFGSLDDFFVCFRSFGVTLWELLELGNQPYRHYSDRQVLTYAVKEQQLKLPKPQLQFPLADRW